MSPHTRRTESSLRAGGACFAIRSSRRCFQLGRRFDRRNMATETGATTCPRQLKQVSTRVGVERLAGGRGEGGPVGSGWDLPSSRLVLPMSVSAVGWEVSSSPTRARGRPARAGPGPAGPVNLPR